MFVTVCLPYLVTSNDYYEDVHLICDVAHFKIVEPDYKTFDSDWDYYGYTEIEWELTEAYIKQDNETIYLDLEDVEPNLSYEDVELYLMMEMEDKDAEI